MRKKSKKGISTLVATVLLIVITIVAIGIIWGAILPLVQKGLGTSQACSIETRLQIVKERGMTCYKERQDGKYTVFVEVKMPSSFPSTVKLSRMNILIATQSGTKPFDIRNGPAPSDADGSVTLYGSTDTDLILPSTPGESVVYNITVASQPIQIGVAPVVKIGEQQFTCEEIMEPINSCS